MIKVALTGNIASGKSTVQKILEDKGYKVLDTDKTGHMLLDTMPEIKEAFNDYDILNSEGLIDRDKLGKIVFSTPTLKQKLENIIHPAIKDNILRFFEQNKSEDAVFVGIPLLFESDMRDIFDKAVLIYTDDFTRKERLILRNNYTPEYAELRMKAQIPQDEKKLLCDDIIFNNGTLSDLENSVEEFLHRVFMR